MSDDLTKRVADWQSMYEHGVVMFGTQPDGVTKDEVIATAGALIPDLAAKLAETSKYHRFRGCSKARGGWDCTCGFMPVFKVDRTNGIPQWAQQGGDALNAWHEHVREATS